MLDAFLSYFAIGFISAVMFDIGYGAFYKDYLQMRLGVPHKWFYPFITVFWSVDLINNLYHITRNK